MNVRESICFNCVGNIVVLLICQIGFKNQTLRMQSVKEVVHAVGFIIYRAMWDVEADRIPWQAKESAKCVSALLIP